MCALKEGSGRVICTCVTASSLKDEHMFAQSASQTWSGHKFFSGLVELAKLYQHHLLFIAPTMPAHNEDRKTRAAEGEASSTAAL